MIFSNGLDDKVRDGSKTQTRRLVKRGDRIGLMIQNEIIGVYGLSNKLKWAVGHDYAIQSGRGKWGNGRFRITKIRKERLQDISIIDCYAEGTVEFIGHKPIDDTNEGSGSVSIRGHFGKIWNSIYKKPSDRWDSNPSVWVLEFELVGEADG